MEGDQRRLASIVAIDVAGYSARAEADERAAAAEIATLGERIAEACEAQGGRVFNTAGDGFMLEFPTVSGALAAAETLAAHPQPPIRIGIHLGEVIVTPAGDLLGHGVNVAARIQSLATPGSVLISDDARRAVRGPLSERLVDRGTVRLEKMDETVRVFALSRAGQPSAPRMARRWQRPSRSFWIGLAAMLLIPALFIVSTLGGHGPFARPREPRVAVLPFRVVGDDVRASNVASGLVDEIAEALSGNQLLTVSTGQTQSLRGPGAAKAAARLGAAFILDGAVERDGEMLKVRIRLDDTRDNVTLWSDSFSGPAARPEALQIEVAAKTSDIVGFALQARREGGDRLDAAAMADFLTGNALMSFNGPGGGMKARPALIRLTQRAPDFARGHSTLALAAQIAARTASPQDGVKLRQEARVEAERALALDPKSAEAYLALSGTVASPFLWAEREGWIDKGLAIDPDFPYLNNNKSYLLSEVGQTAQAVIVQERGLAVNNLHPGANYRYALLLAQAGRYTEARAAVERLAKLWPKSWTDQARLALVMIYGPQDEASDLLKASRAHPYADEAGDLKIWSLYLAARYDRGSLSQATAALKAGVKSKDVRIEDAILALCQLGDLDGAFALADDDPIEFASSSTYVLFSPVTESMRRDPRFWPLTRTLGLARYWRETGHWPDVCIADLDACKAGAGAS